MDGNPFRYIFSRLYFQQKVEFGAMLLFIQNHCLNVFSEYNNSSSSWPTWVNWDWSWWLWAQAINWMGRRKFHWVLIKYGKLHHHYFIAHPTEQKDQNDSGIETLSFFFRQEWTKRWKWKWDRNFVILLPTRANKCLQASYGQLLESYVDAAIVIRKFV
jgi:hypothetical protein